MSQSIFIKGKRNQFYFSYFFRFSFLFLVFFLCTSWAQDLKEKKETNKKKVHLSMDHSTRFKTRKSPQTLSVFPFKPGEKIVLDLWSYSLYAGEVVLKVVSFIETTRGFYYKFSMTIKTSSWISFLFNYKYEATSYAFDDLLMRAYIMSTTEFESKRVKKTQVRIDDNDLIAYYIENVTLRGGQEIEPIEKEIPLSSSNTRDLLNAIYYVRTLDLKGSRNLVFPVLEKSNLFEGRVQLRQGKRLKIGGKNFNTRVAVLSFKRLNRLGRESKFKRVKLWLTDDQRKIVVRIEIQLKNHFLKGYFNSSKSVLQN